MLLVLEAEWRPGMTTSGARRKPTGQWNHPPRMRSGGLWSAEQRQSGRWSVCTVS